MELELYNALKAEIETKLKDKIKHVALFNNQFFHLESAGNEIPFLFPCVFLEFSQDNFRNLSQGVQEFDLHIKTYLGFESYKNEDTEVLALKQDLFKVVQRFRNGFFDKLTRVSQTQDFDHSNIQVYTTEYKTYGKDYTTDIRPTMSGMVTPILSSITISMSGFTI